MKLFAAIVAAAVALAAAAFGVIALTDDGDQGAAGSLAVAEQTTNAAPHPKSNLHDGDSNGEDPRSNDGHAGSPTKGRDRHEGAGRFGHGESADDTPPAGEQGNDQRGSASGTGKSDAGSSPDEQGGGRGVGSAAGSAGPSPDEGAKPHASQAPSAAPTGPSPD